MLYDTEQDLPRIDVAFARFVALGHRPSQAARLAGYSATVAPRIGWRLLQRPEIAARVAAFRDSAEAVRRMPAELVQGALEARIDAAVAAKDFAAAVRLQRICDDLFLRGGFNPAAPQRNRKDKNDDAGR